MSVPGVSRQHGVVPEFTIGDRLRKARELTGLDQTEFALEIGVSRSSVSNWESGSIQRVKPIVLRAWALRTGVSLEWLATGIVPNHPGNDERHPEGCRCDGCARRDSNPQPSDP